METNFISFIDERIRKKSRTSPLENEWCMRPSFNFRMKGLSAYSRARGLANERVAHAGMQQRHLLFACSNIQDLKQSVYLVVLEKYIF